MYSILSRRQGMNHYYRTEILPKPIFSVFCQFARLFLFFSTTTSSVFFSLFYRISVCPFHGGQRTPAILKLSLSIVSTLEEKTSRRKKPNSILLVQYLYGTVFFFKKKRRFFPVEFFCETKFFL